jgi:hypothetical protein
MRIAILSCLLAGLAISAVWDPEVRLTDNTWSDYSYWSCQRRIAVDPQGCIHVAWYAMNSGLGTYKFQVYYKRWTPAAGWSADTMISADLYTANLSCKYSSIAVDSSGRVWVAWTSGPDDDASEAVYAKSCVPGDSGNSGWDAVSCQLSTSAPTVDKNCPTLTATPDGHVHAAWLEGNYATIVHSERIDTVWQPPVTVEGGSGYRAYPAIAGGPDSRLHLIWYGRPGSSGFYEVYYKSRTGTTWGATEEVSYGEFHQMYPNIAVNPATGYPHVLWQCYVSGNYRRAVHSWRSSGGWQPTDTLSEPGDTLNQDMGQIVFTPDGIGHAVWYGRNPVIPSIQIRYAERSRAGDWSAPFNVTDTASSKERPSIAAGGPAAPNDIHVVWTDYLPGNAEIFYAHAAPGQWVADRMTPHASRSTPKASIVRGILNLTSDISSLTSDIVLVDVSGRRILALRPGANDISRLAPGVYYVVPGGRVLVLK